MVEPAELVGRTIGGKYALEALVGGGAMGHVYRARHTTLGSQVAIKIMRSDVARDPSFRQRFLREARAASRLDHPCSVRVMDWGEEEDGTCYLAMEFLGGRDLLAVIKQEFPLEDRRIVEILVQALSALTVAHGLGIVHRDIKPENIMITTELDEDGRVVDRVKVCDFGIAKLISDPRTFQTDGKALTTSGMLIGTPEYMSPEQARGDTLDERADLYSMGVVLYHLLAGKVPFTAENTIGLVLKHITDEPTPPSKIRPGVNPRLEAICMKAMRKDKEQRFASAKDMRNELRAALDGRTRSFSELEGSGPALQAESVREIESARTLRPGEADLPRPPTAGEMHLPVASNRGLVVGVAIALLVVVVVAIAYSSKRPQETPAVSTAPSPSAPASSVLVQPEPTAVPSAIASEVAPQPKATSAPSVVAPIVAPSAHPVASAVPPVASASAAASSPIASAAPSATAPYRPSSANVALGNLTTERVSKPAVSTWIGQRMPKLTECYQSELSMLGQPAGGSAQLALSVDDTGAISAIVAAPGHAIFAKCAQQALAGSKLPSGAVEAGGGTASQWLSLVP